MSFYGKKVVTIDNSSSDDCTIVNNTNSIVICCCREIFGAFNVILEPDGHKPVVPDACASVFEYKGHTPPFDYREFEYDLGKSNTWYVEEDELGNLIMEKR